MESPIKQKILKQLGREHEVRIFNNPVGSGWCGESSFTVSNYPGGTGCQVNLRHARRITFGLCKGSADLIGLRSVVVTPDMVGKRIAIFVALEVKDEKKYARANQRKFRDMVAGLGGISAVVRSPLEAHVALFDRPIGQHEGGTNGQENRSTRTSNKSNASKRTTKTAKPRASRRNLGGS